MHIEQNEEGDLIFSEIDPLLTAVLRQIPEAANPHDHEAALDRIYCDPVLTEDPQAQDINDDWSEYVRPELRHLFESTIETVRRDLDAMTERIVAVNGESFSYSSLTIPAKHLPAWINGLNQARIVLAERHGFGEADMNRLPQIPFQSAREFALWQVSLYAEFQLQMIYASEGQSEEPEDFPL